MSDFVGRVSQYPVVEDTCKAASDAYNWAKSKGNLACVFTRMETAAFSLASIVKPVLNCTVATKLNDLACHQLLDRFETLCPTLKDSSTEELLGPVANRALSLAETCANYCLPEDQYPPIVQGQEPSRKDRLTRLQSRASYQALSMFHASVGRAHELLAGLSQTIPSASIATTFNKVTSILSFAGQTAMSVGHPIMQTGLTRLQEQVEKLSEQLKESGAVNWVGVQTVIHGLDKLRSTLNDQLRTENGTELEMQPLPAPDTPVRSSNQPNESNGLMETQDSSAITHSSSSDHSSDGITPTNVGPN